MSKDKPQNWWDADETVGTTAPAKNWWDEDEPAQPAPKPAPAMQMQPAPKPAPMPMQSGRPNISPMGGVGEFDPKAFAGLKLPQQRASTENPIITEQRRQQDLAGRNFAAQQPGRMAKEQRWKDELAAMNAAGVIPFKNNGPDGPLELNQERPDQFFGRAAGSFVNSNIGVANLAGQVGLNTANAFGAAGDPSMQGALAGGEYGDISQRVAEAATAGGYAQNQQKIDDIIPSLPIPAAQTAGEMGADVTGNLAAVFTGWGAPVLKGGQAFSETLAAVPGLSRTLRGVGVETGENAALAYGMGAGAAPPGSDRNMAGTQSAADPLNYVSIEALRALGRIPGQIDRALPATNAGGARPGPINTAALQTPSPAAAPPTAAVTPNAPAAPPAPPQPPVTAVPSFQRQPIPTATAQAAGAPPIQPPPPAVATANAPVPTPGAVPPAGTLTPVGNGVAVDSFNNLPVKTREGVLRALEASGMNRQQAFDAITSLNDLPPDRANMFEFELIRRYGGPDKFPNLQANLTTMGSDFSIQTPKRGGSPQDVMNKSLLDQAQSEGDYLTRTAEQLFGEGKVATKEELEAFRTQLGGRYRTQLAETYPGMTRLRSAASKQALAATVDAGRKNLTDYLLRPDVIEQVPPWVQDQVMMQVSDDLRWLQKDDAGLQFASKANPELTPLLTSDQTLRYSPQLWRTLVQMYPTQVGHSLQSAYRAAIDDAFSGVSNAIDRTTAKKLMRLRGQSRVRANASDPNKRGVGLLHLLEEASPGYKKLRQEYGDVVGAQKAADMPDSFFRVAKDEEALADFMDVYDNELTPLQQNAVRNGITTQIRQALKNKTEFTQPWEVDAASRGHLPNMTAISSQTFLEALPKVFGRDGERMADAIRLSRANVDNIQAINKNFASGTPKGIDIKANANQLYEHPAATKLNPVDNFATTMGSVGLGTAFVPGGQMVSIGLLTGAAGRALYRAYKQGKSLSPSQKEALAEWLFKPRRDTDPMPPSAPRGFSKLGYAGNVATGTGIGAAAGAASSGGDPATTAEGAVIGALGGGARAGLRARRAGASIIKPPPARGPRRGPPPFGGNRVTGAGPAPQITPPGSPPVQNGFFGSGRQPPKPPVPKAPVAFKRDPAMANLSPGDMVGYIEAKYPPAAPNLQPPYFTAANAINRANGDRAAATKELADYAAYLKQSNSAPEVIENAERTVRAVADVDPIFFDDAAFNASMKGRIEAGGTAAMEQGAKPAATSAPSSVTPLKPAPKPPTRQGIGGSKLPMDEGARMARAQADGFDTSRVLYHGTNQNIEEFVPGANRAGASGSREGPMGVWLTNSPETASSFSDWAGRGQGGDNVLPVYTRLKNPLVVENYDQVKDIIDQHTTFERPGYIVGGRQIRMAGDKPNYDAARKALQDQGYDGIIVRNTMVDSMDGKPIDQVLVLDPANIRGKFAKFDPAESSSSKLLAGLGGPSGAGAAGGGILGATLAPDANGDGTVDAQERANGFLGGAFSGGIAGKALGSRAAGKFGNRMKGPPKFRAPDAQTFGGVNAKTADRAALGRAQNMEAEGADRNAIWDATGWFKGVDGKWRFEIDDSGAKIGSEASLVFNGGRPYPSTMQNVMEHPELYAAYPDMATDAGMIARRNSAAGVYEPDLKSATAIAPDLENARSIMLHEAGGHGVQEREGFARGGSIESFTQQKDAELARDAMYWRKEIAGKRKQMPQADWIAVENALIDDYKKSDIMDWLPSREARDLAHDRLGNPDSQLQELVNVYGLDKNVSVPTPREMYRRTAGEVEARNIQTRDAMRMRGETPGRPWETQDVPDDQQIVRFGSGKAESRPKPPPANRLSGGQKPESGVLGNMAKRAAVGAATGAAVNLATSAGAEDDLSGKIGTAEGKISSVEQEIAALKKAKADFDKITDLKEKQRLLNRVGLYNGDIDGKFKGLTTDAINAWDLKNAQAIEKAETALAASKKDLEALKKQDAYRQMQKEQNPFFDAVRELGPSGAAILGGVAATVFRVRSVGKSAKAAKAIENDINDLLTNGPVKRLMAKGGADNKPRNRAVNMNQFYREGGAPDNKLPFNYGPSGWKPNPKAVKPGSLYKSDTTTKMDGVGSQFIRPTDVKIIGAGLLDSALVTPFVSDAEEELRKAEADVEGGNESVEALRRVEKAKTNLAMYQAIQRLGWGIAGAGALGLGYRYKLPKPDIRGAEDEVTAISDYLKSKAPPRTPRQPSIPKPQPVAPPNALAAPTTQLLLPLPPPKPKKPKKP